MVGDLIKSSLGIATERSFPKLRRSLYKTLKINNIYNPVKTVYLYLDEFTNYNDTLLGRDALALLEGLGYRVQILPPTDSGRTYISKGFLK